MRRQVPGGRPSRGSPTSRRRYPLRPGRERQPQSAWRRRGAFGPVSRSSSAGNLGTIGGGLDKSPRRRAARRRPFGVSTSTPACMVPLRQREPLVGRRLGRGIGDVERTNQDPRRRRADAAPAVALRGSASSSPASPLGSPGAAPFFGIGALRRQVVPFDVPRRLSARISSAGLGRRRHAARGPRRAAPTP